MILLDEYNEKEQNRSTGEVFGKTIHKMIGERINE
jgi:hypothetical protein